MSRCRCKQAACPCHCQDPEYPLGWALTEFRCSVGAHQTYSFSIPMREEKKPVSYLLQFFSYNHLPPELQKISEPFSRLAWHIKDLLPENPERTTALRKLLEAKDCAVRAKILKFDGPARDTAFQGIW